MKKRSSYRPRPVIANPLGALQPVPKRQRDLVMLTFLTALDEIANGRHPGEEEWRALADATNLVETLALSQGKLPRAVVLPILTQAVEGMKTAAARFKAGQSMRFDAPSLNALREVVDIYGQSLEQLTHREMSIAQHDCRQRLAQAISAPGNNVVSL